VKKEESEKFDPEKHVATKFDASKGRRVPVSDLQQIPVLAAMTGGKPSLSTLQQYQFIKQRLAQAQAQVPQQQRSALLMAAASGSIQSQPRQRSRSRDK
jgi:hypothetical protein